MSSSPQTARLIVSVILEKEDKILVIYEADDKGAKRLNLPGGHVEPGEGLLEASIRETREETGLDIKLHELVQIISSAWKDGTHSVRQTFRGEIMGGTARAEEESEIRWMSRAEIEATPSEEFVFGVKDALRLACSQKYISTENYIVRNQTI